MWWYPIFILVKSRRETHKYGGSDIVIHKYVLMDGSCCLIKAATDSMMSCEFVDYEIEIGSSLVVMEHFMVWVQCESPLAWRSVMIIKKMKIRPPPTLDEQWDGVPVPKQISVVAQAMIDRCDGNGSMTFPIIVTHTCKEGIGKENVNECIGKDVACGAWILGASYRSDWQSFCTCLFKVTSGNDDSTVSSIDTESNSGRSPVSKHECSCCTDFGFTSCVLVEHPVSKLQKENLFFCLCCRFFKHGDQAARGWRDLSGSHKRWCIYWWYAVNVFQIHSAAMPLPSCFVDFVCNHYPNKNGSKQYTGFKSTSERAKHHLWQKKQAWNESRSFQC